MTAPLSNKNIALLSSVSLMLWVAAGF